MMKGSIAYEFVGDVCIGTTGRLGICTHIENVNFSDDISQNEDMREKSPGFRAAGFGLDGKGIWTSENPFSLGTAEYFYNLLKTRFDGKLTWYG